MTEDTTTANANLLQAAQNDDKAESHWAVLIFGPLFMLGDGIAWLLSWFIKLPKNLEAPKNE